MSHNQSSSVIRVYDSGKHAYRRGLARAVWTEKAEYLTLIDFKADVVYGDYIAITLGEVRDLYCKSIVHTHGLLVTAILKLPGILSTR
jgi:hypothetical protein